MSRLTDKFLAERLRAIDFVVSCLLAVMLVPLLFDVPPHLIDLLGVILLVASALRLADLREQVSRAAFQRDYERFLLSGGLS